MKPKKTLSMVELTRFVGMLLIMSHHLYHIGYKGNYTFKNCWVWVDFYFILTGAFTARHYAKTDSIADCGGEALRYTVKKFKRFMPCVLLAVFVQYSILATDFLLKGSIKNAILAFKNFPFEAMLLSSTGIVSPLLAPIWYLSAMLITMPILVYCLTKWKDLWKIASWIIPALYFGHNGVNTVRAWPNDFVRAFACMSLGVFVFYMSDQIAGKKWKEKTRALLTFVELACFAASLYISILNKDAMNLMELFFAVQCMIMLSGESYTGRISGRVWDYLGSISLPMFLFHWTVGSILIRLTTDMKIKTVCYYLCTLIAAMLYQYIEKTIRKKYNRLK